MKKKLYQAVSLLSKIRHHTSKHLLKSIQFWLFNSHLIYGCQIRGQEHSNELKTNRNTTRESNKNNKISSQRYFRKRKDLKILKLNNFITLQYSFFIKDSLINEGMASFHKILQQSTTTQYQNTWSASSFVLRKRDFKTEKYGRFSIVNKCLSDLNQLKSI